MYKRSVQGPDSRMGGVVLALHAAGISPRPTYGLLGTAKERFPGTEPDVKF